MSIRHLLSLADRRGRAAVGDRYRWATVLVLTHVLASCGATEEAADTSPDPSDPAPAPVMDFEGAILGDDAPLAEPAATTSTPPEPAPSPAVEPEPVEPAFDPSLPPLSTDPSECAIQGSFAMQAHTTRSDGAACGTIGFQGISLTTVIDGGYFSMSWGSEPSYPAEGTIDANCVAHGVRTSPLYREYQVTFDPATRTGQGLMMSGTCVETYAITFTLEPPN